MKYTIDELREFMEAAVSNLPTTDKGPDIDLMVGIAMMESGGDPFAHNHNSNGTVDRGLWQINDVHMAEFTKEYPDWKEACYTPIVNAHLALLIWMREGYKAWSTYNRLS